MGTVGNPSIRPLAREMGFEVRARVPRLGWQTTVREDLLSGGSSPTVAPLPGDPAGCRNDGRGEWGAASMEPLNRMAEVAMAGLAAAQQLTPAVSHHDGAETTRTAVRRERPREEGRNFLTPAVHAATSARCTDELPRFNASPSVDGNLPALKGTCSCRLGRDRSCGPYGSGHSECRSHAGAENVRSRH